MFNLELHLKWTSNGLHSNRMLDALAETTSHLHAMFMHHIVEYACVLIADTVLLHRSYSGDRSRVPVRGALPPVDLPGKQTPLFIPIQSHSLAPALFY